MPENWVGEVTALRAVTTGSTSSLASEWPHDVLTFWFYELTPSDWFKKSRATDGLIASRFLETFVAVSDMPDEILVSDVETARAAIIVLDQFSRNLFRGDPMGFATDEKALAIATRAISAEYDAGLDRHARVFMYLPFEHSEDLGHQKRSVELISAIGDDELSKYARAHYDVIAKFGRFPHRNAVLGRTSTAAEEVYLAEPGSGF